MLRIPVKALVTYIKKLSLSITESIQYKLIIIYLIVIGLPVITIGLFSFGRYFSFIEKKVTDSMYKNLTQISNNLDNYIEEIEKLSLVTYSNEEIQKVLKAPPLKNSDEDGAIEVSDKKRMLSGNKVIYNYFIDLMSSRSEILGLSIFCENGQAYKMFRGENVSAVRDFRNDSWYKAIISSDAKNFIFTKNMLEKYCIYPERVITFCKVIKDPETFKNLGVIVFSLDSKKIKDLSVKYDVADGTRILITNADGRIIYYTNEDLINRVIVNNFFMDVLYKDSGRLITNLENEKYVVVFNTSRYTGWKVAQIINSSTFYKEVYNLKLINYGLIFFIVLVIIALIYESSAIIKPLKTLTHAMSSIDHGSLDTRVDIESNDEIGRLSKSFNAMVDRINALIVNVSSARLKQKEAELRALQSQINPHFLYNTLEMIGNIAAIEDVPLITNVTNCMGKMFRYTISSKEDIVTIRDEINHLKNYMVIQQLRFSNRFDILFDIEKGLEEYLIPKLLLQPLIENSVHHGLERKRGKGIIILSARSIEDKEIEISVRDNGVGIDSKTLEIINRSIKENYNYLSTEDNKNRGLALVNVNMRITLFFGDEYGMKVESNVNEGTTITLRVPAMNKIPEDY